jgi:hypothetical protein
MNSKLVFQNSYWLILVCFAIGIAYAWLLYSKKTTIGSLNNKILAAARAILVAFICFLLLNPLLKSNSTRVLKPILVLGVDNSKSITQIGKNGLANLKEKLSHFTAELESSDYEFELRLLEDAHQVGKIDSILFNAKKTDFGSFFRTIKEEFSGQNLRKVILVSDGIENSGLSPLGSTYPFSIETIGIGDTTIKRDISIKGLTANKLAYLGNSFPVDIDILAQLYNGKSTTVLIKQGADIIDRKVISFNSNDDYKSISFNLNANKIGKQLYTIHVLPLAGESSVKNNARDIIIDVVDGKEKILLVGLTPHPDIKALKSIIEKNPLFELNVRILTSSNSAEIEKEVFDILILHQLPSNKGDSDNLTIRLLSRLKPTLFILGAQSDLGRFNGMQEVLGISGVSGKTDKVTGQFNPLFTRFNPGENNQNIISKLPPVIAPFGEYRSFPGANIILFQKVGNVVTDRALLSVNTNAARKSAVLVAEGIWQWRMEDYFMNESHDAVDEYILKSLQLISVKDDKEKLRVYSLQNEIDIDESVVIMTEAYDDLFERIYNVDVKLNIQGPEGYSKAFNYSVNEQNSTFEISRLTPGVYNFQANGLVLGKNQNSTGQFVVRDKDLEFLNTTADYNFLRTLSNKNDGGFYQINELNILAEKLKNEKMASKLINTEDLKEIINLKWLLPLLLLLISLEWGFRKYLGTY